MAFGRALATTLGLLKLRSLLLSMSALFLKQRAFPVIAGPRVCIWRFAMRRRAQAKWMRSVLICSCFIVNSLAFAQAKPGSHRPPASGAGGNGSEIRRVDFRNFTFVKPGKVTGVRLSKGKFEDEDNTYTIERIIFGDLDGDGHEEAIVSLLSEYKKAANPMEGEWVDNYVYTMRNGQVALLAMVNGSQVSRDYARDLKDPDRMCTQPFGNPSMRRITHGMLVVAAAGGGRFCPSPMKYDVTLHYRWDGVRFVLAGRPVVTRAAKSRH